MNYIERFAIACTMCGDLFNRSAVALSDQEQARVNNSRHSTVHAIANRSKRDAQVCRFEK
jgi:hypothetical protein